MVLLFSNTVNGQTDSSQFLNPIVPGFHPDPSCTFVASEETFYCASSSFNAFPGIPIHASKDLRTWRLVGELVPQSTLARIIAVYPRANYRRGPPVSNMCLHTLMSHHVLEV